MASPDGQRITYAYDPRGLRESLSEPGGGRFTYAYDGVGRSASLVNPQGERTTWTYDLDRPAAVLLANGTRTSYTHDGAGQTRGVIHRQADGSIFSSFEYDYDPAGNRTGVQEADGARVTWTYDATNQLIRERRSGNQSYDVTHTYDPAGNRTLANADGARTTYNQANELTVVDGAEGVPLHFAPPAAVLWRCCLAPGATKEKARCLLRGSGPFGEGTGSVASDYCLSRFPLLLLVSDQPLKTASGDSSTLASW